MSAALPTAPDASDSAAAGAAPGTGAAAAAPAVLPPAPPAKDEGYTGCEHYKRKCQLLSACCNEFFACRFCHDAVKEDGERDPKKMHTMDRHKVKSVVCMRCSTVQPSAQTCTGCGVQMGKYFCGTCNLFDDADKGQWHCTGCGICRVGGQDNFEHCAGCGTCIRKADIASGGHKCRAEALHQQCPICCEWLHTSREAATFLRCKHAIHASCLRDYQKAGHFKCPLCNEAFVDLTASWRQLDLEVAMTPMPEEYRHTLVEVLCNDCHNSSWTPFHITGLKCRSAEGREKCGGSYNTRKAGGPREATEEEKAALAAEREAMLASAGSQAIPSWMRAALGGLLGSGSGSGSGGGGAAAGGADAAGDGSGSGDDASDDEGGDGAGMLGGLDAETAATVAQLMVDEAGGDPTTVLAAMMGGAAAPPAAGGGGSSGGSAASRAAAFDFLVNLLRTGGIDDDASDLEDDDDEEEEDEDGEDEDDDDAMAGGASAPATAAPAAGGDSSASESAPPPPPPAPDAPSGGDGGGAGLP